jgi:hypothetical protein
MVSSVATFDSGTYISSDSAASGTEYSVFNAGTGGAPWVSAANYNVSSGVYTGSASTIYMNNNFQLVSVAGEYIELDLPFSSSFSKYYITPVAGYYSASASDIALLGWSDLYSNWVILNTVQNKLSWTGATTFDILSSSPVSKLRLVLAKAIPGNASIYMSSLSFGIVQSGPSPNTTFTWNGTMSMSDTANTYMTFGSGSVNISKPFATSATFSFANGDYIDSLGSHVTLAAGSIGATAMQTNSIGTTAIQNGCIVSN